MKKINIYDQIHKIYLKVEKSIDKSNLATNQYDDEIASKIFEDFLNELIEYKINTTQDIESFANYLSSKFLASNLDTLDPTLKVKTVRKTICKILDKIIL